ncbi:winged helix-turn-helix domain-containing protein [Saccharomonospora sp. NPDC006951]
MGSESAGLAPFERVAAAIRHEVMSGKLEPGAQLPSNRNLAQEHDVSLPTLQRAVAQLQEEGWLVSRPSVGVFVAEAPPKDAPILSMNEVRSVLADLRGAVAEIEKRLDRIESRRP